MQWAMLVLHPLDVWSRVVEDLLLLPSPWSYSRSWSSCWPGEAYLRRHHELLDVSPSIGTLLALAVDCVKLFLEVLQKHGLAFVELTMVAFP
jgi:hypothetical protein